MKPLVYIAAGVLTVWAASGRAQDSVEFEVASVPTTDNYGTSTSSHSLRALPGGIGTRR